MMKYGIKWIEKSWVMGHDPLNHIKEYDVQELAAKASTNHILIKEQLVVLDYDSRYLVITNTLLSIKFPLAHSRFSTTRPKYVQSLYTFFSSLPLTGFERWTMSILPNEKFIAMGKLFTRQR